jgi:hypothetical protein
MALIKLFEGRIIPQIEKDLKQSVVITLFDLNKVVSGATAKSVRTESETDNEEATISVYAGCGMKYIIEGKPANTKYPMKKEGNKFVLLDELKYWKKLVGFQGSDFLLARTIAQNKRDGIDVAGKSLEYFEKTYLPRLTNSLLSHTVLEVKKIIPR